MLKNLTNFRLRMLKILEMIKRKGWFVFNDVTIFKRGMEVRHLQFVIFEVFPLSGTTSVHLLHYIVTKQIFWLDLLNKTVKGK